MPIDVEKRRSKRGKVKPGVNLNYRTLRRFPFLKGKYKQLGAVIDISCGGISVEYDSQQMLPTENVEYSLTVPEAGLQLEGIRMSTVSDFVIDGYTGCGGDVCRRRGFRFSSLTSDQKEVLLQIMEKYALDPVIE
jgi:hypothetical protein